MPAAHTFVVRQLKNYNIFFVSSLRLAAKKKRGGGKGRATKEKSTIFKTFFFILLPPFKNKNYFTLDNLSKYGHITLKFVGRYFYLVVTIFSKK